MRLSASFLAFRKIKILRIFYPCITAIGAIKKYIIKSWIIIYAVQGLGTAGGDAKKTNKKSTISAFFICDYRRATRLVPRIGLEPIRYCYRGILSPLRLPVPPSRLN